MTKILIVIPTYKRCDLLDRTLKSLAECWVPSNLEKIIITENGINSGAEQIAKKYSDRFQVEYQFTDKPNKSNALNKVLEKTSNEFLVFFDDDIRVRPDILEYYSREVGKQTGGFFLCGRVSVDHEEKPPEWILGYFPPGVRGWHFNAEKCKMMVPAGIGMNWGAFATDLKETEGFDERRGPGSGARGQESDMMERLLNRNIIGYYLPDC